VKATSTPAWHTSVNQVIQASGVYFRPLKKGVVLPIAIVKRGVELPLEHIKKGVATP